MSVDRGFTAGFGGAMGVLIALFVVFVVIPLFFFVLALVGCVGLFAAASSNVGDETQPVEQVAPVDPEEQTGDEEPEPTEEDLQLQQQEEAAAAAKAQAEADAAEAAEQDRLKENANRARSGSFGPGN